MTYTPYAPLNCLKSFAGDVWLVDGDIVRMRYLYFWHLPFPTRMTVTRLRDGRLILHSPTALTDALRREVDGLGVVAAIVAPNRLHWVFVNDWAEACPEATVWAAPNLREHQPQVKIDCVFGQDGWPDWTDEVAVRLVEGRFLTEAVLFHRASRTLILTDLIENFEAGRFSNRLLRCGVRLAGCAHPDGAMPVDLRQTFRRGDREAMRATVDDLIAWAPERIVVAHGRCYVRDGAAELKRAFRWLPKK